VKSWASVSRALAASIVATRVAAATASKMGVVDSPGPLKPQAAPVPYLGGLGVLAGVAAGTGATAPVVLVPIGMATALGTADDCFDLSPGLRAAGQLVIGAVCAATSPPSRLPKPLGAVLLTGATFVLINGMNLIDGLDGLAGGVAMASAGAFAGLLRGKPRVLAAALAGACGGFLVYNRPPAKVYLGDGGSYLIGASLATLLGSAWSAPSSGQAGPAALLAVAVPAAEVALAVVRRYRAGLSLTEGDRGHPYDRLVEKGWSSRAAAAAYVAAAAGLGSAALFVSRSRSARLPVIAVGVTGAIVLVASAFTGSCDPNRTSGHQPDART